MKQRGTKKNVRVGTKEFVVIAKQILSILADVLGVGLVLTGRNGQLFTEWQYPSAHVKNKAFDIEAIVPDDVNIPEQDVAIVNNHVGKRRFVLQILCTADEKLFVQSDDLPTCFAWIDGELTPQVSSRRNFSISHSVTLLLSVLISYVFDVIFVERGISKSLDELETENVHRIGVCLRTRIVCDGDTYEPPKLSLVGVPGLKILFPPATQKPGTLKGKVSSYLTKIFKKITKGTKTKGAFNMMSLNGDFLMRGTGYNKLCSSVMRMRFGDNCFVSDIKCLIRGSLVYTTKNDLVTSLTQKCPAGFTEVFAPVYTDGLIVGLVMGGQLIASKKDAESIVKYMGTACSESMRLNRDGRTEISRTRSVVSGLSALIGLMFEKYCIAESGAELGKVLVELRMDHPKEAFREVCLAIKRLLAASECSAFLLEGNYLVLIGTTANELMFRKDKEQQAQPLATDQAIGRVCYHKGDGITGSVVLTGEPRFVKDPTKVSDWAGYCSEDTGTSQVYVVPIMWEEKCYGVLRIIKPSQYGEIPITHRDLIKMFASELGIIFRNHELTKAESEGFKEKADQLQSVLAEAAHEYKGPLHNVLSLVSLFDTSSDKSLKNARQMIKEEVYRAKRIMDNYLLRGVMNREKLEYNFQNHKIGDLVRKCASRFEMMAAKKGVTIRVLPSVWELPEIAFDHDRIDQVLSNMLDNATKYSFSHTTVIISGRVKKNTLTVSVTDLGLGIPNDMKKEIFEGYQRSVEDGRVFKPGTGLGLMIAKKIVDAHRGNLSVESNPEWGDQGRLDNNEGFSTKFILSLPKNLPVSSKKRA